MLSTSPRIPLSSGQEKREVQHVRIRWEAAEEFKHLLEVDTLPAGNYLDKQLSSETGENSLDFKHTPPGVVIREGEDQAVYRGGI